jgi:hypothetical protein
MFTLPQAQPQSNLASQSLPCVASLRRDALNFSEQQVDIVGTTSTPSSQTLTTTNAKKKRKRRVQEPSTVASPPTNKKTILSVKSKRCKKSTQHIESSKTSVPASTTNAKGSRGFWQASSKVISNKLWLPTGTDLHGSALSLSSGLSSSTGRISSLKTKRLVAPNRSLLKTSWQLSTFSAAAQTANEDIPRLSPKELKEIKESNLNANAEQLQRLRKTVALEKPLLRGRHYRLKLNNVQRRWMLTWFKDCRRTYNQALNVALDNGWHKDPSEFNYRELEKRFVAAAGVTDKTVLRTPKAPRQQALKSLHSDFKRHATNLKQHQAKLKAHKTKLKKDGNY